MKVLRIFLFLSVCTVAFAQPGEYRFTQKDYIEKYSNDAVKEMQRSGVPASITLAQGILESESGNSDLARIANNHFGIKCHNEWTGESFHKDDDSKNECFRKYNSVLESYDDHSKFLRTRNRYAFLFELKTTDYKGWARGLKEAGYATNPQYASKLIKLIEDFNLHYFDTGENYRPSLSANAGNKTPVSNSNHVSRRKQVAPALQKYEISKNNVPYVIAKPGDTYFSLANENNMMLWQVLKYNDADKNDSPGEGEIIYVMPKRNQAVEEFHIVKEGEDMHFISQLHAVKLKKLLRRNHLAHDSVLQPGQKIFLR
ncbi:MAG: glucosaminidase domain-containing protein [Bacteroidia bacterium]